MFSSFYGSRSILIEEKMVSINLQLTENQLRCRCMGTHTILFNLSLFLSLSPRLCNAEKLYWSHCYDATLRSKQNITAHNNIFLSTMPCVMKLGINVDILLLSKLLDLIILVYEYMNLFLQIYSYNLLFNSHPRMCFLIDF